jgi:hypothetical protein
MRRFRIGRNGWTWNRPAFVLIGLWAVNLALNTVFGGMPAMFIYLAATASTVALFLVALRGRF